MTFKVAFIQWVDSTYFKIDFCPEDYEVEIPKPRTLISCGLVLHDDNDCISICQDIELISNSSRMVLVIPKVSILKYEIKKIKVPSIKNNIPKNN